MSNEPNCPFCLENKMLDSSILYEDSVWYFASLKEGALQNGGMAITKRHIASPFDLTQDEWSKLHVLLPKFKEFIDADKPDGYNIGWNVNATGGQTVPHAHLHIIARYADEPLAGKGIRYALKHETNKRPEK